MTICILPTKKDKGLRSSEPETAENDENDGCPSDKTTVCQKHCFRHPDGMAGMGVFDSEFPKPSLPRDRKKGSFRKGSFHWRNLWNL